MHSGPKFPLPRIHGCSSGWLVSYSCGQVWPVPVSLCPCDRASVCHWPRTFCPWVPSWLHPILNVFTFLFLSLFFSNYVLSWSKQQQQQWQTIRFKHFNLVWEPFCPVTPRVACLEMGLEAATAPTWFPTWQKRAKAGFCSLHLQLRSVHSRLKNNWVWNQVLWSFSCLSSTVLGASQGEEIHLKRSYNFWVI